MPGSATGKKIARISTAVTLVGLATLAVAGPLPTASAATITATSVGAPVQAATTVARLAAAPAGRVVGRASLGTFDRHQTKSFTWRNANSDAYQVGIVPSESSGYECTFAVTRTVYWRSSAGARQLTYDVRSDGEDGCSAEAVIIGLTSFRTWSTGSLRSGSSKTWTWNNANPLTAAYTVGFVPGDNLCRFQTTRTTYRRNTDGEREFAFTVKNVGDATCTADVNLVQVAASDSWSWGDGYKMAAGVQNGAAWDGEHVIVGGLTPLVNKSGPCTFDIDEYNYMRGADNPDGSMTLSASFWFTNRSSIACATDVSAAYVS